jgi:hypothetical protein
MATSVMIVYPAISPLTGDRHAPDQVIGMAGLGDRHRPDSLIDFTGIRIKPVALKIERSARGDSNFSWFYTDFFCDFSP